MRYERMTADGMLHAISPTRCSLSDDTLHHDGAAYAVYAVPSADAIAYVPSECIGAAFSDCVTIALPLPLGKHIYPASVIWSTPTGLADLLPTSSTRKSRIHGINLSSWEDSDEEVSDAEDGGIPLEDEEESDQDIEDCGGDDISDVEDVSDCGDDVLETE